MPASKWSNRHPGRSAQSTAGRNGSKALLAEVALGQVGIVLSLESTRLSRHGTAWSPSARFVCLEAVSQCGSRRRRRRRDPQRPSVVGDEGDRERGRTPSLARSLDPVAAKGPARRLGPGLTGGARSATRRGASSKTPTWAVQQAMTLVFQTFWSGEPRAKWSAGCVTRGCARPVAIATVRRSGAPQRWRRSWPSCGILASRRHPRSTARARRRPAERARCRALSSAALRRSQRGR